MSTSPSYITREELKDILLLPTESRPNLAIIDVRDDDHVGGHIMSSTHVPSVTLDFRVPELVRTLRNKDKVVFHCALSQQRGPGAARRYLGERDRVLRREKEATEPMPDAGGEDNAAIAVDHGGVSTDTMHQEVYVLDGGFVKWQEK